MPEPKFTIQKAVRTDVTLILQFIKDLAEYEGLLNEVVTDEPTLLETLFCEHPYAFVLLAYLDEEPIGFALYFHNFSTFLGRPGVYLEDLYIKSEHRGNGYGKALLRYLAKLAVEKKCGRLQWWCLDENTPSAEFYKAMGAQAMDEWTVFRIDGNRLKDMAQEASTT